MQIINWKRDLGGPTNPGKYLVRGLGQVEVGQDHIDQAKRLGDTANVEVHDVTSSGDSMRQFILGIFGKRVQTMNWNRDLSNPNKPGKIMVAGIGEVEVSQDQIDQARTLGRNVNVEVHDVTASGDWVRQYIIGLFVP